MSRFALLLTILLTIVSCNSPSPAPSTGERSRQHTAPVSSTSRTSSSVDIQCRGEAPAALKATFGAFRIVQASDFVSKIQQLEQLPPPSGRPKISYTCGMFTADFNQDGNQDYAVLLVNPQTKASQFRLIIKKSNAFTAMIVRNYPKPPQSMAQPVYVAMLLKPAGEAGAASHEYFPLKRGTSEREVFIAQPALEVWLPPLMRRTTAANAPREFTESLIGYSSETFYFVNGQLKQVEVAD